MKLVQINVRVPKEIDDIIELMVKRGLYNSKKEAVIDALKMLIKKRMKDVIDNLIDEVREGTKDKESLSKILVKMHEEEDLH